MRKPHVLECDTRLLVDNWEAGIEIHKEPDGTVTKEEVERAARQMMEEPEGVTIRMNVKKLRDKVKSALGEGGSVERSVKRFVDELQMKHPKP